jgi:SAM-dependent methyltransferase
MKLNKIYRHRFSDQDAIAMNAIWKVLVTHFFQRWISSTAEVLDVGAGRCAFINNVQASRKVAFDANPSVSDYCAPEVEFFEGTDLSAAKFQRKFDIIFVSNFLEHLRNSDEVLTLLGQIRDLLKPSGQILILQPNFSLIGGQYFDFIDHKTILTDRSLVEALELTGYKVCYLKKRFLPYTSKSSLPQSPWLVRLYLLIPLAHYFLGKQTFVVATPDG